MNDTYFSIKSPSNGEFKDKGSKFLAFAFPVTEESEIKEILTDLKQKYWDASHHCYAYMLGPNYDIYRANDAGEPSHSAGDPILSQIKSLKLTDVLVVVVRYFGGTKLGVSGLITAYKAAALEALQQAVKIEKIVTESYKIEFASDHMSIVMKTIKNSGSEISGQHFDHETLKNILKVEVRKSATEFFLKSLQAVYGIEISPGL